MYNHLIGLYTLALRYRELGLIQFLIENFGVKPPLPPKSLTIDNVCIIYEKALKDGNDVRSFENAWHHVIVFLMLFLLFRIFENYALISLWRICSQSLHQMSF